MDTTMGIPVTVLTGFLGSGKTTLLNYILSANHGLRVGVIINEFGEISIDHKLITGQRDDVIELANGCVCCTMRGDLLRAIQQVLSSQNDVEYILIETTGLADPLPIAQSLLRPELQGLLHLDSIVTLVDAAHFDENLDHAEIAYNQMVYGDILLINKADLVDEQTLDLIEKGIRTINPDARILRCVNAQVDLHLILGVGAFQLEQKFGRSKDDTKHEHSHDDDEHLADFEAIAFRSSQPINPDRFQAFMHAVPTEIFRGKGVLRIAGMDDRMIFHQVGDRCTVVPGEPWAPDEERLTELVFIGRHVNKEALLEQLRACLVST